MTEVSLIAAFMAGVLALMSPCSALLLPSFFAYAFASRTALVTRTFVFYIGLALTLVPLGMGSAGVSKLFLGNRDLLIGIAGWVLIVLGVAYAFGGSFAMPFAQRLQSWSQARQSAGWISTVALGAVYGFAGFCSGPILGAILTVAATKDSIWQGGLLLAIYGLGMAAPLLALATLWDRFDIGSKTWMRGRTFELGRIRVHSTSLVAGVLFALVGVLFLRFDGTAGLTGFLGVSDTTDSEFAMQEKITEWSSYIPAWALPAVVLVIAASVLIKRLRSQSDPGPHPDDGRGSGSNRDFENGSASEKGRDSENGRDSDKAESLTRGQGEGSPSQSSMTNPQR